MLLLCHAMQQRVNHCRESILCTLFAFLYDCFIEDEILIRIIFNTFYCEPYRSQNSIFSTISSYSEPAKKNRKTNIKEPCKISKHSRTTEVQPSM